MIVVAVVAAAVGAVVTMSVTQTPVQAQAARPAAIDGKPNFSGIWQANNEANWDLEAHAARPAAVTQQGASIPMSTRACPAAPVLALGAAAGGARIARRRAGRRSDSVQAGSPCHQAAERGELDRPRPGAEVLPAGHAARDVHAPSVPDHAEHEQDPPRLLVLEHGAHDPSGRGRRRRPTTPGWDIRSDAGTETRSSST